MRGARPIENLRVRAETPADCEAIETLTVAAFLNAPHTRRTEQHIVNALRKAGRLTVSLVAHIDAGLIGHVALSPVSISDGTASWFGLGPISVVPRLQRLGVGSRLMREGLRTLREQGASGCVVLGEPEYYGRFGFRANPALVLPGVPAQYFQAVAFDSSTPQGTVSYHEAFEARG
jgi:putative acetyltransferase